MKYFKKCTLFVAILTLIFSAGLNAPLAKTSSVDDASITHTEEVKTTIKFNFEAGSIAELNEINIDALNNFNIDDNSEACEATVEVTVSVGVVSVSLSATASCDEIAETANRLIKQAKQVVAAQL